MPNQNASVVEATIKAAGKFSLELAFAEAGKDTGLLPINSFVLDIEDKLKNLATPNEISHSVKMARACIDRVFNTTATFDAESLTWLAGWQSWLRTALGRWLQEQPVPEFPASLSGARAEAGKQDLPGAPANGKILPGKPAMGTIQLRVFHRGGNSVIQIQDDGNGLNKEKLLAKAREKGIVKPNESLSDTEIYDLIFAPGFSTAEKITGMSGRGVGMADCPGAQIVSVILTGMGSDGALGMKAQKDVGAKTIVQDQATSVVYGMPRAAAELGVVDQVLPLPRIAPAVVEASHAIAATAATQREPALT